MAEQGFLKVGDRYDIPLEIFLATICFEFALLVFQFFELLIFNAFDQNGLFGMVDRLCNRVDKYLRVFSIPSPKFMPL